VEGSGRIEPALAWKDIENPRKTSYDTQSPGREGTGHLPNMTKSMALRGTLFESKRSAWLSRKDV